MAHLDFRITDPDPTAPRLTTSRVVSVSGVARAVRGPTEPALPGIAIEGVRVEFGPGGPVVAAARSAQSGVWTASGTLSTSTPDDSDVKITATAFGTIQTHQEPDVFVPLNEPRVVTVHLEPHPPELTITDGYPNDVTPASLPYPATISGTTSGVLSGITGVRFAVQGGPSGPAQNDPPGDWSRWHAQFGLPETRNYPFTVTATDARGRELSKTGAILVRERFENTDPAIVFGPTTYVRELCDFARQYVSVDGQPAGPDRAALAARFHQPFDRLPDPPAYQAATSPVDQRRIAVEVLRLHLATALPADTEQRFRALAYQSLLGGLGTSVTELRRARVAEQPARTALAARLGIALDATRPDRLDDLTVDPDQISDDQLETLFGFASLRRTDPFAPGPRVSSLQAWRQAALTRQWRLDDSTDRDGATGPLPVIDPDHVGAENLASTQTADPAHQLWSPRRDVIASLADDIDQVVAQDGGSTATFDTMLATHLGVIDLPGLAAQDAAGEDVTEQLRPLQLGVIPFRYLAGARSMLAAGGSLLGSEWTDVRDILVQVAKLRMFDSWRQQERAADVVLQPAQFVVGPQPTGPSPNTASPSIWRADRAIHQDWQRTLALRAAQLDRLQSEARSLAAAAEADVLPVARAALLGLLGAGHNPPEDPGATAERLTRELCIDLRSDSGALTTRADQAAETLLEALVALRSGRLSTGAGGPHWSIAADHEPLFDREWESMGSYQGWYAAITAFSYPENQLFPGLYLPNGLTLTPTPSYQQFLNDLRAHRITGQRARDLAAQNWERLAATLAVDLKNAIADLVPLHEVHSNQQLGTLRTSLGPLYTAANRQLIRELFWLVPVALGLALTDAGEFTAALDWYQYAYAYQLPDGQRRIFPGLVTEHDVVSSYGRSITWPADGTNPHEVAVERADAYTRFTVMSIVRCLLADADGEYVRSTAASNARSRALYEAALDLVRSDDAAPQTGPDVPFPANPVHGSLQTYAATSLDKIHRGLNIAATLPDSTDGLSVLPSQYRYAVLVERAKNLVGTAAQLEAAFLTAAEQADAGAYAGAQAAHDLDVARAMIGQADLKVAAAGIGLQQANSQTERAGIEADHFGGLLAAGPNDHEREQLFDLQAARDLAAAGGIFTGLGSIIVGKNPLGGIGEALSGLSQAAALDAQIEGAQASFERQQESWQLQQSLAIKDIELGREQIALAVVQQKIAVQEREIAGVQLAHAAATAEFLATKFTNTELFEWMSGVLNQVYAYFLRQATALARLAQSQLAFERQEPNLGLVQGDYWQGPPDPAAGQTTTTDRRGLTGSERLLQDITRLDQYAFETNRRKLHLTQTLPLAQYAAAELAQFKQTGVLTFATPQQLFDRRFPGHYLRLINRVKVSMIALVPPVTGLSVTLSASGFSRTVVARGPFQTVTLRREPEAIAITSPSNASGLFELEPDNGMLLPFEGMGVDTVWRLELPKPANPFDFRTITDVLLTLEYTALDDPEYRHQVIQSLDRRYSADRSFSIAADFPDTWYDLNNPDSVEDPARRMRAVLALTRDDFPPNIADLSLAQLTLFAVRADSVTQEVLVTATRHTVNGQTVDAGAVTTIGGIVGTRRAGGAPWQPVLGSDPTGTWELQFEDTPQMRSLIQNGSIRDAVLVMTVAGTTAQWP